MAFDTCSSQGNLSSTWANFLEALGILDILDFAHFGKIEHADGPRKVISYFKIPWHETTSIFDKNPKFRKSLLETRIFHPIPKVPETDVIQDKKG